MPNSSRMTWPYPAENQQPWYDAFSDFVAAMDVSGYATREDRHLIFSGGGTITWVAGTSTLAWSADIELLSAISGFRQLVAPATISLDDGKMIYVNLTRGPASNIAVSAFVAGQVPSTDAAQILCVRLGSRIFWRNGLMLNDGDVVSGIGCGPTGGGGVLAGDVTGPIGANTVTRIRGVTVSATAPTSAGQALKYNGTVWIPSVDPKYASIVVGNAGAGDTAGVCDVLDSGNGVGLQTALAAAAALPSGGDVVLRPGVYDLATGPVAAVLTVPVNVRLRGAHHNKCVIRANNNPGGGETLSVLRVDGEAEDLTIIVPKPLVANPGAESYVVYVSAYARARRVHVQFDPILVGEHTLFGVIRQVFKIDPATIVEECESFNAPSFRWSGAAFDLVNFDVNFTPTALDPFRVVRCLSTSNAVSRGGDIGCRVLCGRGYVEGFSAVNPWSIGVQLSGEASGVHVRDPSVTWTASGTTARYMAVFGELSGTATSCDDNHIIGGYAERIGSTVASPAVLFKTTGGGNVRRNQLTSATIRGWPTGVELDGSLGTVDGNAMQLNMFQGVATLLTQNLDTNTVFQNNPSVP